MSRSNIVCRSGVGPTATKALFVTHGLGIGAVTARVGGDDAWYRKKLKNQQAALEVRRQEKLEQAALLRRQIEEAANPPVPEKPVSKKEKKAILQAKSAIPELKIDLALLENELLLLQRELQLQAMEYRSWRDEEDIKVIVAALNHPFQTRH